MTPVDVVSSGDGTPPGGDGQRDGVPSGDVGVSCDRGTYIDGYCYFTAGLNSMDYTTAKALCTAGAAEPASIHSQAANDQIFGMMLKVRDAIWIGLLRSGTAYAWEDATPLDFTNWASGEPDSQDCAVMVGPLGDQSRQGMWVDSRCSSYYEEIVCRKKP